MIRMMLEISGLWMRTGASDVQPRCDVEVIVLDLATGGSKLTSKNWMTLGSGCGTLSFCLEFHWTTTGSSCGRLRSGKISLMMTTLTGCHAGQSRRAHDYLEQDVARPGLGIPLMSRKWRAGISTICSLVWHRRNSCERPWVIWTFLGCKMRFRCGSGYPDSSWMNSRRQCGEDRWAVVRAEAERA